MNANNRQITTRLVKDIDRFVGGELELLDLQSRLQSALTLLERDGTSVGSDIHLAEVDMERIQFTMLLAEQRPAAVFRLDELRDALVRALEGDAP
jgi:hypothetical protein